MITYNDIEENAMFNEIDQYLNAFFQTGSNVTNNNMNGTTTHTNNSGDLLKPNSCHNSFEGEDSGFVTCNSSISSPHSPQSQSSPTYSHSPSNHSPLYSDRCSPISAIHSSHGSLSFEGITSSHNWNITNLDQSSASSHTTHTTHTSQPVNTNGLVPDIKLFNEYQSEIPLRHIELKILKQPESHHRARYMTEGSRGTIKDSTGRGYPVVQLIGYNQSPVKLQCFIGHDQKIGEPHLFYQACEVSGKTPYKFTRVNGINMIEIDLLPKNNMQVVIDCIGILKERNVDVERKVLRNRRKSNKPVVSATEEARMLRNTNKKRSSHCRLVFRCALPETADVLQAVSDPILCTQPLGTPEIYKMSLREADIKGGQELYIIGKNFHKDSKVVFECGKVWRKVVVPHKDFLNSTHLICEVPAFECINATINTSLINIDIRVNCNHKSSDPIRFTFTNK